LDEDLVLEMRWNNAAYEIFRTYIMFKNKIFANRRYIMVNKKIFAGILVIILGFGMTVTGCDIDNNGGGGTDNPITTYGINGTWYSYGNVNKYIFDSGYFEYYYNGNQYKKGIYTTTNDSMTMTITHIGSSYYSSSYTWLDASTWYSRDEFKAAYVNYHRDRYRAEYQQVYDTYVANYGVTIANSYFQSSFGTTDIDSIVDSQISKSQIEDSIDSTANQLYTSSTVAYSFDGATLILGGTSLTRN
jgi:hypothetical protein